MINAVEQHRDDLEALAEQDDLRCSKYAKALLETIEEQD